MAKINILTKETINKIAAGEVVERPSSIVKELLENAIDAGANAITVEIKDGGISLIRITDNGAGIDKDDIKNAFLRHATSKIKTVEDLVSASTLGFRGEALSSIAAVTKLECVSKTRNLLEGTRYVIEGGKEIECETVGAPNGTTFIVKDLFFNTPVRRKFLKTAATETSYITSIVEKMALSHPEISFRYISNNQNKFHTSGNNNLKDVIYMLFGRDVAKNLYEVNCINGELKLSGFIGKPILYKGNKNSMIYFINGRYIKNPSINKAILDAYKNFLMQHNFPFCVLHFEIPTNSIDVNVHPTKMEVKFENQEEVFNFFKDNIESVLKNKELIHDISLDDVSNDLIKDNLSAVESDDLNEIFVIKEEIKENKDNKPGLIPELPNFNKKNDSKEKSLKYAEPFETEREKIENDIINIVSESDTDIDLRTENKENQDLKNSEQINLFKDKFLSETAIKKHRIIGEIFETYWLVQFEDNLYIIDQHAAHEKVLYEKYLKDFENKNIKSQILNPPIIVSLSDLQRNILERFLDELKNFGYEIEDFGGKEVALRSIPYDLYSLNPKELLINLIDSFDEDLNKLDSEIIKDKIASMSCKAAVKGHDRLSFEEAKTLIDKLLTLDNPYNCPHGRPTIISMSKYEIEKKFKRIV